MVDIYTGQEYPQRRKMLIETETAVSSINVLRDRKDIDILALARTINKKPRIISNIILDASEELVHFSSGQEIPKYGAYRALVPILPYSPNGDGTPDLVYRLFLREQYETVWRISLFGILRCHEASLNQIKKTEWNDIFCTLEKFIATEASIFADEQKAIRYRNEIGGGGVSLGNYMLMHMKWDTPYRKIWHNDQNHKIHTTQ
jgi:hypothetical protein